MAEVSEEEMRSESGSEGEARENVGRERVVSEGISPVISCNLQ